MSIDDPNTGMSNGDVFDKTFTPLAMHDEGERLLAIDIGVLKAGAHYILCVVTQEMYDARAGEERDSGATGAFILQTEEIFVEDLTVIKQSVLNTDDMDQFLIPQTLVEEK